MVKPTKSDPITEPTATADLEAQRKYVARIKASGLKIGLTVADAFIRGIRDVGYRSTATALNELVDNAIQAGAQNVHVVFGFQDSDTKPAAIAVIDDGHGMDAEMIPLAVVWGGTHREDNRDGFGRYGYGLPSASVSQGKRFTVFSRVSGGEINKVTLDLDEIGAGAYTVDGDVIVPGAVPAELPSWVRKYLKQASTASGEDFKQGTVVLIEKADRLTWKTALTLQRNLLEQFGVTYRNFLRQHNLYVDGKQVEPVDPLFTTAGARFYDLDEVHAVPLPPLTFEVRDEASKSLGIVKARFASFPPTFTRIDKSKEATGRNANARMGILRDNNGIIVLRNGRQIDVVRNVPGMTFGNNDRYWAVEIDFPATLDEVFSITTSKQHITLSERMLEILKKEGVWKAIERLRVHYREAKALLEAEHETDDSTKRPSEAAMEASEKFNPSPVKVVPVERTQKAEERLKQEARRKAEELGVAVAEVERRLIAEKQGRPYRVRTASMPGAPFYRVEQVGGQKILELNTAHRFYTDVYAGPSSSPRLRSSLEVMLFVLGDSELDATDDRQLFYQAERNAWSLRLSVALDQLDRVAGVDDDGPDDIPAAAETEIVVAP